jgi:hypothetical protein
VRIPFEQQPSIGQTFINLAPEVTAAILATLQRGWLIAKQRREVNASAGEIVITECLRDGMREALNSGQLPWRRSMIVLPGTESRSEPATLVPDGRTDIPVMIIEVFFRSGQHDPHAIIECKRVAESDSALVREYVTEGIDRFRSGKYGKNHSRGFMAGYVVDGAPDGVVLKINAYLDKHARKPEQLSASIPGFWISQHPRQSWPNIELHHSMFVASQG